MVIISNDHLTIVAS